MPTFGNRNRFRIEIASKVIDTPSSQTRVVDVWAAGQWLTNFDNTVHVPQFTSSLRYSLGFLLSDASVGRGRRPFPDASAAENLRRLLSGDGEYGDYHWHRFMDWGPTLDDVSAALFREDETTLIPFALAPAGHIFVAEVPERELLSVLHEAAWALAEDR